MAQKEGNGGSWVAPRAEHTQGSGRATTWSLLMQDQVKKGGDAITRL